MSAAARSGDLTDAVRERVTAAFETGTPLAIAGGESKAFLGNPVAGAKLLLTGHGGIIDYQPAELVITARSGTPLSDVEAVLAEHGQMLAFEPPHLGSSATLGGCVAAGLSGPRRPFTGAVRDSVLGTRVINGRGEALRFGGQVMKNVAGYDVSRLMAGSMGTLGILMDVSLKLLPVPAAEKTLVRACTEAEAIDEMNALAGRPLPLSAAYWEAGKLFLRVSGTGQAVDQACRKIGGDLLDDADFWQRVRELKTEFFADADPLWRMSLPPATPALNIECDTALDWGGAQRWLKTGLAASAIRSLATEAGGHATLFRGQGPHGFHPLDSAMLAVHQRLKKAMDPAGILNPGRLYPDL